MAIEVRCGNCQYRQSKSICGSSVSPNFKQIVESSDRCDSYLESPAQKYLGDGSIKSLSEGSPIAGMEDLKKAIEIGLPEDDELFARFVLAEGYVNLALAQRGRLTEDEFVTSTNFVEALNQAEKAILLDRKGQYGYFSEPLNRARLRIVDELYPFAAGVLEKRKGVDAAIDYIQKKVALLSYLSTTPLIRTFFNLGDLYEQKGQKDSAVGCYRNIVECETVDRTDTQGIEQEIRRRSQLRLDEIPPSLSGTTGNALRGGASMKCFYHPDADVVGICQKCGKFCCRQCIQDVSGTMLCKGCVQRGFQSQAAKVEEQQQSALADFERQRQQAKRRIGWSWAFAFFGAIVGLMPFISGNPNEGPRIPVYIFVPLAAYDLWGTYWGFVWFWPRWRKMVARFRRALSGWIIIARPFAWFMILLFYLIFYLSIPFAIAAYYGIFGGGIFQYLKHRATARNLSAPAAGTGPRCDGASSNRPGPIIWITLGAVIFGAILLATVYISRRGTAPSPAQSPSPLQAVASSPYEGRRSRLAPRAAVPAGLVSYYHFNYGNSSDSKGTNNGTDHSVTYGTGYGVVGQGAGYPANTGYTTVPNMQTSWSAMTISAWFYPAAKGVGNFIDFRSGGVICQIPSIGLGYDSNGSFYISKETAPNYTWKQLNSTSVYAASQWYFVVGTYRFDPGTGQGTISLYVNGDSVATPLSFTDIQNSVPEATSNFHAVNGTVQPVAQYLDDVAIFSRALTFSQVSQLYAGERPTQGFPQPGPPPQ